MWEEAAVPEDSTQEGRVNRYPPRCLLFTFNPIKFLCEDPCPVRKPRNFPR